MTSWLNPVGWMGPIFDKELRVASRRKRTYWLRIFYVGALGLFLVPIWLRLLQHAEWTAINSLSVSEEAIEITTWLIVFQFIALQILSAIFLSPSISEEINHRTLGTLWTTPIRGFEVVVGKLSSKIAILLQMLAISLPFLMTLRMFGGIPWGLIVGGCALTLATVFLVGSLSLTLSVFIKKPYMVLVCVALFLFLVFGLIPVVIGISLELFMPNGADWFFWGTVSLLTNPYYYMIHYMDSISGGTVPFPWGSFSIQICEGILLLLVASRLVRIRGLRAMDELPKREDFHPERYHPKAVFLFRPWFAHMLIKQWLGPGMIWKESVSPFFHPRHRMVSMVLMAIGIGIVLWILLALTVYHAWASINRNIQGFVLLSGFSLGVLITTIASVTVITGEMEGQSWPILLTTPLSNARILGGKIYGVLRRSGWIWAALIGWVTINCWQDTLEWKMVLEYIPLILLTIGFVISLGFYLALRCKRAMPAITIGLVVLLILWIFLPLLMNYMDDLTDSVIDWGQKDDSLFVGVMGWFFGSVLHLDQGLSACYEGIQCCNPLFFFFCILLEGDLMYSGLYDLYEDNHLVIYIISTIVLYACLGFLFSWRAHRLVRQRVFE